jgi:hypothetical protein
VLVCHSVCASPRDSLVDPSLSLSLSRLSRRESALVPNLTFFREKYEACLIRQSIKLKVCVLVVIVDVGVVCLWRGIICCWERNSLLSVAGRALQVDLRKSFTVARARDFRLQKKQVARWASSDASKVRP